MTVGSAVSDHCPLLLDHNADLCMGKRYKFEAFWTKAEGFLDTVVEAWGSVPREGNPVKVLDLKLRAMAKSIKKWSDRWIGNVKLQIAVVLEIIFRLDKAMELRNLFVGERGLRRLLKHKQLGLCSLERSIARQQSRILYLKEGDGNTGLFHQSACHQQCRNMITSLTNGSELATSQEEIATMVDSYYNELLGTAPLRAHSINLDILGLPHRDMPDLDAPFTEEGVWKIVKSMPLDKAPGPDRFTGRFYATC
ncbi:uncharacterized protein [Aegilops tauschii subsp. strangulata]|uniref:uncharacterized protein n=1 Tax=Aegilops tauschii subsp. strangulata TaxID=200361 RepID=UPI003CC8D4BC